MSLAGPQAKFELSPWFCAGMVFFSTIQPSEDRQNVAFERLVPKGSFLPASNQAKSVLRKAGLFYFVWVMFSYCTGRPFGLEDMVTTAGPGMTLIYLLVLPFFWCIPVSLVS